MKNYKVEIIDIPGIEDYTFIKRHWESYALGTSWAHAHLQGVYSSLSQFQVNKPVGMFSIYSSITFFGERREFVSLFSNNSSLLLRKYEN